MEAAAGNIEPHRLTAVQIEPGGNVKHELRGQNRPQAQVGKTAFSQLGMNTFRALIQGNHLFFGWLGCGLCHEGVPLGNSKNCYCLLVV